MSLLSWVRHRFIKLTDPADWPVSSSYTGKTITPEGAMQLSTWWSCVRLISETVATLPIGVFNRSPDGSKNPRSDHPLYTLLHDSPNADQTAAEFWEGQIAALCIWGNGYSEKKFEGSRLIALEPIMPDLMTVERTKTGALEYRFTDRNNKPVTLPEDRVFHIRGFGVGGDTGLSPVSYARQTLSVADAIAEAAGKSFKMGMRSSGFFEGPPGAKFTPEQRASFKKTFIDPYVGLDAKAQVGLLESGFKFNPSNIPAKDAEMLLSWKFSVEEICRWLRVPPVLIGHAAEGQTMWGSGIEQIMLGWLTLGLRPYLTRVEQAIKKRLLLPAERSQVFAEFNVDGLLRADSAGRSEMYSKLVQVAAMTPNQICDKENFPRFPDGDIRLINSTFIPLANAGKKAPDDSVAPAASIPPPGKELSGQQLLPVPNVVPIRELQPVLRSAMSIETKQNSVKTRDFEIKFKAVEDDGTFTGYGSVFGVEDAYGEIVAQGAFADSLKEIKGKGRPIPVLWQHSSRDPIGVYEELSEDKTGLYVKGRLLVEALPLAKQAHALMKVGAVSGLSIGYMVRQSSFDEKTFVRTLLKLDLMEISIVTFPANDEARVDAIKAKLSRGETITIREFEGILREKGFSRSDAEDIAALGYKPWLRRESGTEARSAETVKLLSGHLSEAKRALQTPLLVGDWR